jgi:alpha-amylase/alpha-mannosidase (GH57 family)
MERYICIHGHFYQPPRENPWLEDVEVQDSAYPYHDWNERITAECYAPNTASRILEEGYIVSLPNNYARISFNFGPSLLAWLEQKAPAVYAEILAADRMSQMNFSGHGSALAQAYSHLIMPLANRRDKYTQVIWGIQDFRHRFGRSPEGMWLPETAVDLETLDIMAELGLGFTILAPHQARQVRPQGEDTWTDVSGGRIDPKRAYALNLPSGRRLSLFFYDGPVSRAVAFEGLLSRGENLVNRLMGAFGEEDSQPQLVHIATDGETYGHHQRHGDMALAYALKQIETENQVRLTNYGEYLEKYPATWEVEIFEGTSWSCAHGVERWRQDFGCDSGSHPGWNQSWRGPLRESLDWLRDTLAPHYEARAGQFLKDPWAARNDYIQVVLDRSLESLSRFWSQHASRELSESEKVTALQLLGVQRAAMLMYTSCGWFFDELSGLETVQILQYAARALWFAAATGAEGVEEGFLTHLSQAKGNLAHMGDGHRVYEQLVKPVMVDLMKVGAHYAVSSLFEDYPPQAKIYCFFMDREDFQLSEVGIARLAAGLVQVTSEITRESALLAFGALHFGEHNLTAGVQVSQGEEAYHAMLKEVTEAFAIGDFPETIRRLDRHFEASTYSINSLFRDEQRKVLNLIMEVSLEGTRLVFRQIYGHHVALMRFLIEMQIPLPNPFFCTAQFVLNLNLRQALENQDLSPETIGGLLEEALALEVKLDAVGLAFTLKNTLESLAERFRENPGEPGNLRQLEAAVDVANLLPFEVNLWKVQNIYYELGHTVYPEWRWRAERGEDEAHEWTGHFAALGEKLMVRLG